jgi:hypothetical protein
MGNVMSSKSEIVGQYFGSPGSGHSTSKALRSQHRNIFSEDTSMRSRSEVSREEEGELVGVHKVIDYADSASDGASNPHLEVLLQAPLTSMVEA